MTKDYYYVNGNALGDSQNGFNYNYTPVSDHYPPSSPGQYVVQSSSESLQNIAFQFYGDASLWYLIADANGLSSDTGLTAGQTLTIPNQVTNLHNNSSTYKPYSPGEVLGDNTPALQAIPPPPSNGCGMVAMIVIAVVVIVATVLTAGAAAVAATGFAATGTVAGAASAVVSAGISGLAAAGTSAGLVAGAIGAAVGNIAGQLAGNALGVSDGFSWGQVAMAGVTSVFGSALGQYAGPAFKAIGVNSSYAQAAIVGAVSNAGNQGIGIALGRQDHFSWTQVAAASASSVLQKGAGALATEAGFDPKNYTADVLQKSSFDFGKVAGATLVNFAGGVISRETQVLFSRHGKVDFASIAADSFGNALGNSIVGEIATTPAEEAQQAAPPPQATPQQTAGSGTLDAPAGFTLAGDLGKFSPVPTLDSPGTTTADLPAPATTITVGAEGARGLWGVAASIAGPGASKAEIKQIQLQLETANPGVTILHEGDTLHLGDGSISRQAVQQDAVLDANYQANLAQRRADAAQAQGQLANLAKGSSLGVLFYLDPNSAGSLEASPASSVGNTSGTADIGRFGAQSISDYMDLSSGDGVVKGVLSEIIGIQSLPGTTIDGIPGMVEAGLASARGYSVNSKNGVKTYTYAAGPDGVRNVIEVDTRAPGNVPAVRAFNEFAPSAWETVGSAASNAAKIAPPLSLVGTGLEYAAYNYTGQAASAGKEWGRDFAVDATLDMQKAIAAGVSGAAVGSIFPVGGTAIGAVVGFTFGVVAAYGIEQAYAHYDSRNYFKNYFKGR